MLDHAIKTYNQMDYLALPLLANPGSSSPQHDAATKPHASPPPTLTVSNASLSMKRRSHFCFRPCRRTRDISRASRASQVSASTSYAKWLGYSQVKELMGLNSTSKVGLKIFEFTELERATRSFHPKHMVDEVGLGSVFKGWIRENSLTAAEPARTSRVIAVRRIEIDSFESNMNWLKEVDYLGKLHHQNLVKLIGYCLEDDHHLLVYEFVPFGNLHNYLFSGTSSIQKISWIVG